MAPLLTPPGRQVWVYGGSLNNGSADRSIYDPTEMIRDQAAQGRRVLSVSFNYRTGAFGFMSSPELLASDPDGLVGNYGLYDCVAALEWVSFAADICAELLYL